LNTVAKKNLIADKYALNDITLCQKDGKYHKITCLNRECNDCGVKKLDEHLVSISDNYGEVCIWMRWESVAVEKKKGEKIVKQSKKVLKKKEGLLEEMISELREETETFAIHLFNAKWQNDQFNEIRKNPPQDTEVQVLDFAENFTCTFQNEVQSAHWNHETCTVHPIVNYYHCEENCEEVVSESVVFISDDLKHDHHAVHAFMSTNHELMKQRNPNIVKYIQWSDGCSSQYKSKGPFLDISCSMDDLGCLTERNYFGSRHGKGPSDGESAVIKSSARSAVKAGRSIIANAKDLYEYAKGHLEKQRKQGDCTHFRRTVIWVGAEEIKRERGRMNVAKTLKGTRSIHTIKCVEPGCAMVRTRSCFCKACLQSDGNDGQCDVEHITGQWKEQQLLQVLHVN
jgi:hypothetical protein